MRKNLLFLLAVTLMLVLVFSVFAGAAGAAPNNNSCWGQASRALAMLGEMGYHASEQPTPRSGLRNLARELAKAGVIPDDSMQALAAFVINEEPNIDISACVND
jgi:hypothetical protein